MMYEVSCIGPFAICQYSTPYGELLLCTCGKYVVNIQWAISPRAGASHDKVINMCANAPFIDPADSKTALKAMQGLTRQLSDYFCGERQEGFQLPYLWKGTDFQESVWSELLLIPYGETISYSELARRVGSPEGARAVANAVAANPLALMVPCHRVIEADGSLGGYAGGKDAKRLLLAVEQQLKD